MDPVSTSYYAHPYAVYAGQDGNLYIADFMHWRWFIYQPRTVCVVRPRMNWDCRSMEGFLQSDW